MPEYLPPIEIDRKEEAEFVRVFTELNKLGLNTLSQEGFDKMMRDGSPKFVSQMEQLVEKLRTALEKAK